MNIYLYKDLQIEIIGVIYTFNFEIFTDKFILKMID